MFGIIVSMVLHVGVGASASSASVELRGGTGGGLNYIRPGRWGLVKEVVGNTGEADRDLAVAFRFDAHPSRQFVRETWVPGRAERTLVWPARLPERHEFGEPAEGRAIALSRGGAERALSEEDVLLAPIRDRRPAAMLSTTDAASANLAALAVREARGLGRTMYYRSPGIGSGLRYTLGWEPIEAVVIADLALVEGPAERRALRRWLRAGGTAWVMADRVGSGAAARVFDRSWDLTEVDRVSFNRLTIREAGGGSALATVEVEEPAAMTRVLAGGFEVAAECRGWPALLHKRVGRGRLIVTTIGPASVTGPGTEAYASLVGGLAFPGRLGLGPGGGAGAGPLSDTSLADSYIRRHVAYEVVGRGLIGGLLAGFLAVSAAVSAVFLWMHRGELSAAAIAVVVVGSTAALLGVGWSARSGVEPTNAQLQVVHAEPGTVAATVEGVIGMFAPYQREAALSSSAGGWAWPRRAGGGVGEGPVRLKWADLDHWRWEGLGVPGGTVQALDFQTPIELPRETGLGLELDAQGVVGTIDWPLDALPEDMMVVGPEGAIAVNVESTEGRRLMVGATAEGVMRRGSFVPAGVVSDTQRHRAELIAAMTGSGGGENGAAVGALRPHWPTSPVLVGWTGLIDGGLDDAAGVAWRGGAMWVMPLELAAPAAGARVALPWPLVEHEPASEAPGVSVLRAVFDRRTRTWLATRNAGALVHRFTWPEAVGAIEVDSIEVNLRIEALGREVALVAFGDEGPIELARRESPDGVWRATIAGERLGGGARRSLLLGVRVGPVASRGPRTTLSLSGNWRVEQFNVGVRGRAAASAAGAAPGSGDAP